MNKESIKKNKGYSVVEIIFYISIFAMLSVLVIDSLSTMTRAFREITVNSDLVSGSGIMERISREIKQAHGVNSIAGSSIGLDTKDSSGNDTVVNFSLSGTNLSFSENGNLVGSLNSPNTEVITLSFNSINTPLGGAVKINLVIRSTRDSLGKTVSFDNTVVLRGNYGN